MKTLLLKILVLLPFFATHGIRGMETPNKTQNATSSSIPKETKEITERDAVIASIRKAHELSGNSLGWLLDQAYAPETQNEKYVTEEVNGKTVVRSTPPFIRVHKNKSHEVITRLTWTTRSDLKVPHEYLIFQYNVGAQDKECTATFQTAIGETSLQRFYGIVMDPKPNYEVAQDPEKPEILKSFDYCVSNDGMRTRWVIVHDRVRDCGKWQMTTVVRNDQTHHVDTTRDMSLAKDFEKDVVYVRHFIYLFEPTFGKAANSPTKREEPKPHDNTPANVDSGTIKNPSDHTTQTSPLLHTNEAPSSLLGEVLSALQSFFD